MLFRSVVALLLKSPNLGQLETELEARFGDIPDFFDHDPLVIDLSPLQAEHAEAAIDFGALNALLRARRLSAPKRAWSVAIRRLC